MSDAEAEIAFLKLTIEKLRREFFGQRSERKQRLLDQLELQLDELEASATEDELAAEKAAAETTQVEGFTRRKPARKPFPAHIPRERKVVPPPTSCGCCGSDKLSKIGEDVTETLEVIPRQWKVIQTVREKFKFILNTRPVEHWIESVMRRAGRRRPRAAHAARFGTDDPERVAACWRAEWEAHHRRVRSEIPAALLLVFDIESDLPERLCDFVGVPHSCARFLTLENPSLNRLGTALDAVLPGPVTRKQLQRGVHTSTRQLEADIRAFIEQHNEDPKPFKWTKSADDILAAVKRFCLRVDQNLCHEL